MFCEQQNIKLFGSVYVLWLAFVVIIIDPAYMDWKNLV